MNSCKYRGVHLASLFGNLLENGISGCQTLRLGKRRFSLTTELRQGNSLYIVSTNSFDGQCAKGTADITPQGTMGRRSAWHPLPSWRRNTEVQPVFPTVIRNSSWMWF